VADSFAEQLAAEAARLAALDQADEEQRRVHASDLTWVTRDRDVALAALDAVLVGLSRAVPGAFEGDERSLGLRMLRRQMLDAGAEAVRRREASDG